MIDSAEQARKFEEFSKKFSDDCSARWQEAFRSFIEFQKSLSEGYGEVLRDEKDFVDKFSPSDYARTILSSYLSAAKFQREQMKMFLDSQVSWNDMYREFLDSLEDDSGAKPSDAQQ